MRNISLLFILFIACTSCHVNFNKRINGNGNNITESRKIDNISKVKIQGGIDVELQPGSAAVQVQADENLQEYIVTREEDGWLIVTTRDNVNLRSNNPIKVLVNADMVSAIKVTGSGNVIAKGKFSGADKMDIDITGSGEADIEVNTPKVLVDITGSGNVRVSGETKDADIEMRGSGNFNGGELMTENTSVSVMGSGNATVYADISLDATVRGSGNIFYKGKAEVKKHKSGSGSIEPIN